MHVVVFTSAGHCFAIASSQIVEVIPVVQARPLPQQPPWTRGLINYRERLIPLLDMSTLLGNSAPEPRLANRVLVLRANTEEQQPDRLMGILVESVLGIQHVDFTASNVHAGASDARTEFLGPVTLAESGTIQLVDASRLPDVEKRGCESLECGSPVPLSFLFL